MTMTRQEGIERLREVSNTSRRILHHLEGGPQPGSSQEEMRELAGRLKEQLQQEYDRVLPERNQKKMTLFELTVYSPTIEEVWTETGISRLKIDGTVGKKWQEVFEAVAYKLSKYTS